MTIKPHFLVVALCFALGLILPVTSQADGSRSLFVEGYTGQVSYAPGESLTLHLSSSVAEVEVEISRRGAKRQSVWQGKLKAAEHPAPENASSHGCQWPAAWQYTVPDDFKSGYYQVDLKVSDSGGVWTQRNKRTAASSCYFIVRPKPGQGAPILLQLATNTYNAYNNWGGLSLYGFHGRAGVQGHRVSFHRPPASQFDNWEGPFITWAEERGIPMEIAANSDLEFHPAVLQGRTLVLSVGHDEYWSTPMRDHLERFIDDGGRAAFFSGNTCCWQVRSEDHGSALTCWKQNWASDPVYSSRKGQEALPLLSSLWSHHLIKRPENTLTGVGFLWGGYHRSHGQLMDGSGAYAVHQPDHWLFVGTDLKRGAEFGGKDTIVGYECDGCELEWRDGLPYPTGRDGTPPSFQVLATAPAIWHPDDCHWYDHWEPGRKGNAVLGLHQRGKGSVFTCGSTDWSHGLRGRDPVVERITLNLLEKWGR